MKKISNRRYVFKKVMDYTGAAFLALLLIFLWQLYRGPIAVPFLKPYIIKALNHDDAEYQVTLDSVNIELVRSIQPIKIIANNVTYRKNDETFVVTAPKTSVSFSIRALLHGVVAPSSIEVNRPTVYLFTSYGVGSGGENLNRKKLEYYFEGFEEFIERFNAEDRSYTESYINDIRINNAEVELHEVELGRKWVLSDLNYRFERHFTNMETSFSALLKLTEQVTSTIGLDAVYRPSGNKLALRAYFADLNPGEVVDNLLEPEKKRDFYQINLPLSGQIETLIDFDEVLQNRDDVAKSVDSAFEKIVFSVEGGSGNILFADREEYKYPVSSFALNGELNAGLDKLTINDAEFDLGGQKTLLSFDVSGLKKYFLDSSPEDIKLTFKAHIDKLRFDDLYKLWPRYIAEKAWLWCEDSIYGGEASNADFVFDFGYDPQKKTIAFQNLVGNVDVVDSNLNYLKGMPDIKNIYGHVTFSPRDLKVSIDKGVSDGVIMTGGQVLLTDLDKEDNFADIKIEAESSITDALKLIDNPPLGYASEMGLKPDSFEGTAETSLGLKFELKADLEPDEVGVDVNAVLHDVRIPNIIQGKAVSAQALSLMVNNGGMRIEGNAEFDDIPVQLVWDENFGAKNYKSKYKLGFKYDAAFRKKFGLQQYSILNAPYVIGDAAVEADITAYENNRYDVDVNADMVDTELNFGFLGLVKNWGEKARLNAKLILNGSKLTSIPSLNFSKTDFVLKSKIDLDKNGAVKVVEITNIQAPKTAARGKIEFANTKKQKIKVNISGTSYDLSVFFASKSSGPQTGRAKRPQKPAKDELEDVTDTDINIAVNRLWTNPTVSVRNFAGSAKLRNGIGIEEMHLIGNYGSSPKSYLKLDYEPRPNKEHMLSIDSNDAGDTLKVLHIYENMRGGRLNIQALRQADKKIVGHAKIRNFSVHNTPILAKLLTVASFSGIVNLLTGEGLNFSHFDAPFTYENQVLSVKDGRAFGNVMGISGSGSYDRYYNELNVKGLFAPAYSLNTLLGKIPLVGNLLSGKDGTVFAANYEITGNINDPKISYNPLSALSPNSLKEMFSSIFGKNDE
jgi:hypothetical protein